MFPITFFRYIPFSYTPHLCAQGNNIHNVFQMLNRFIYIFILIVL